MEITTEHSLYNQFKEALNIVDMRSGANPFIVECIEIAEKYVYSKDKRIEELEKGLKEFLSYEDKSKHILTSQGVIDRMTPIFKELLTPKL